MPNTYNDRTKDPSEPAQACVFFSFDCEEECEDDAVSCRNCRYRRWTRRGYVCTKETGE